MAKFIQRYQRPVLQGPVNYERLADEAAYEGDDRDPLVVRGRARHNYLQANRLRELEAYGRDLVKSYTDLPLSDGDRYRQVADQVNEIAGSFETIPDGASDHLSNHWYDEYGKDPDALIKKVYENPNLSAAAKKKFGENLAARQESAYRQAIADRHGDFQNQLEQERRNLDRHGLTGALATMFHSMVNDRHRARAFIELIANGEQAAQANRKAAQLLTGPEFENPVAKIIDQAAGNFFTIGGTMATAAIPGVGTPLSGAFMATQMGTETYLDLRDRGLTKEQALLPAALNGLLGGAVELFTAKALSKVLGGTGFRGARLQKMLGLRSADEALEAIYKGSKAGPAAMRQADEALKAFAGTGTNRWTQVLELMREQGLETVSGGLEEWIQTGLELAISETALLQHGQEGVIPRLPNGNIDTREVLSQMNDAFIAGAILEGGMSVTMGVNEARARWQSGAFMEGIKAYIRGHDFIGGDEWAIYGDRLRPKAEAYVARRVWAEVLRAKKNKDGTIDNDRVNTIIEDVLRDYATDPLGAALLEIDPSRVEILDDNAVVLDLAGKKIAVVKSQGLGEDVANFQPLPTGATLNISEELWQTLVDRGLNQDVIAMESTTGNTLGHEIMHAVIKSAPPDIRAQLLKLYQFTGDAPDADILERPSMDADYRAAHRNPVQDLYSRFAVWSGTASRADQRNEFQRRVESYWSKGTPLSYTNLATPGKGPIITPQAADTAAADLQQAAETQPQAESKPVLNLHSFEPGESTRRALEKADKPVRDAATINRLLKDRYRRGGRQFQNKEEDRLAYEGTVVADRVKKLDTLKRQLSNEINRFAGSVKSADLQQQIRDHLIEGVKRGLNNQSMPVFEHDNDATAKAVNAKLSSFKKSIDQMHGLAKSIENLSPMSREASARRQARKDLEALVNAAQETPAPYSPPEKTPILPAIKPTTTSVVNVASGKKYDTYIGRGSKWGNPFHIGKDGTREEVITKYVHYLLGNRALLNDLPELIGRRLGCHCAPKPCHGDILSAMANKLQSQGAVNPLQDTSVLTAEQKAAAQVLQSDTLQVWLEQSGVADKLQASNVRERTRSQETNMEARRERSSDFGSEADYAERLAENIPDKTVVVFSKKLKTDRTAYGRTTSGQVYDRQIDALYPLVDSVYYDVMASLLPEGAEPRNLSAFDGSVLAAGDFLFDVESFRDSGLMDRLSRIFGPYWALALEYHRYASQHPALSGWNPDLVRSGAALVQYLNTVLEAQKTEKAVALPEADRNIIALAQYKTQSGRSRPVEVIAQAGTQTRATGVPVSPSWQKHVDEKKRKQASTLQKDSIFLQDLVDFVAERYGLAKTEGLDYADLPGLWEETARAAELRDEVRDADISDDADLEGSEIAEALAEEDAVAKRSESGREGPDLDTVIDTDASAEGTVRRIVRAIGELYSPNLSEFELADPTWQYPDQGANRGLNAYEWIAKTVLNRYAFYNGLAAFNTRVIQQELGEIIETEAKRSQAMRDAEQEGRIKTVSKIRTAKLTDAQIRDLLQPAAEQNRLESLRTALLDFRTSVPQGLLSMELNGLTDDFSRFYDKPANQALIDRVLKLSAVMMAETRTMSEKKPGTLAKRILDPANLAVSVQQAQTLDRFLDTLFGARDVMNMRVQIESLRTAEQFYEIFGDKIPRRMRDLFRLTAGRMFGKEPNEAGLTPSEAAQTRTKYALALQFAAEMLNEGPTETRVALKNAVNGRLRDLQDSNRLDPGTQEEVRTLRRYSEAIDLAYNIVTRKTDLNAKVHDFLTGPYHALTKMAWEDLGLREEAAQYEAREVPFYVPRLYRTTEEVPNEEYFLQTDSGRFRHRYQSLAQAIEKGELLRYEDALTATLAGTQAAVSAMTARRAVNQAVLSGLFVTKPAAGYELLQARNFFTLESVGNGEYDKVSLYAPSEIARHLNRITKSSALRDHSLGNLLLTSNATLKMIRIAWGLFHRRAFLWSALMGGAPSRGMAFGSAPFWQAFFDRFDYGKRRDLGNELMDLASPELYGMVYYGMTGFRAQDIGKEDTMRQSKVSNWAKSRRSTFVRASASAASGLHALTRQMQDELFGQFGSTLKFACGYNELYHLLDKHGETIAAEKLESQKNGAPEPPRVAAYRQAFPNRDYPFDSAYSQTEEDIYKAVAGLMNGDFGGEHLERLGISRTAFDTLRLLMLGPDWTMSNIRTVTKLWPKKGPRGGAGSFTASTDLERTLYARFWARIAGRGLLLTAAVGALFAGLDDESALERLAKAAKRGKFDLLKADISPLMHLLGGNKDTDYYLNLFGHFLDPAKIAADPVRMAYHKSGVLTKPVIEAFTGADYAHKRPSKLFNIPSHGLYSHKNQRRGPLDLWELPAYTLRQLFSLLPIQAQNAVDFAQGEKNAVQGILQAGLGLDVGQTYDSLNKRRNRY